MITIEVRGIPAPQGNHRVNPSGATYDTSRALGPWREAIRTEAQRILNGTHSRFADRTIPVAMSVEFRLPRPASAPRKVRLPAKRPDLDKLARAVLDALVAASAIGDDSQVTCLNLTKSFANDLAPAGALIEIDQDWPETED